MEVEPSDANVNAVDADPVQHTPMHHHGLGAGNSNSASTLLADSGRHLGGLGARSPCRFRAYQLVLGGDEVAQLWIGDALHSGRQHLHRNGCFRDGVHCSQREVAPEDGPELSSGMD